MKILYVGSDLAHPCVTMEAKMISALLEGCESIDSHILSVDILGTHYSAEKFSSVYGVKCGGDFVRKPVYGIEMLFKYFRLIKQGFNIVHFVWVGFSPFLPLLISIAHKYDSKVVVTILNRNSPSDRYATADALVFHSNDTLQLFKENLCDSLYYKFIMPVVMLPEKIFASSYDVAPFFVYLSGPKSRQQIEERGVILLFKVFGRLLSQGSDVKVKFLNRWPDGAEQLEQLKLKYSAHNVEFYHEPVADIYTLLRQSRGVVLPYIHNKIGEVPLSALEAIACNRAVIATNGLGLTKEFSENENVHILTTEVAEWVSKITIVSKNLCSDDSVNDSKHINSLIADYRKKHTDLYEHLLESKSS